MKNTTIIYSPFNLDSCMASIICREKLLATGEYNVTMMAYSRNISMLKHIPDTRIIVIMGADLAPITLSTLIEENPSTHFIMYSYPNSTVYGKKLKALMENIKMDCHTFYQIGDELVYTQEVSLSLKMLASNVNEPVPYNIQVFRELGSIVGKYCRFETLNESETQLLFSNINNIQKSVTNTEPFEVLSIESNIRQSYENLTQEIRRIININNAMTYYNVNGRGLMTPTINLAERDALLAMRFINYSHDDVISFEDVRSFRVYRIYSEKNLDWYIKQFEPTDIWSEGALTFLRTETPKHAH